jgi:hypothetical protein
LNDGDGNGDSRFVVEDLGHAQFCTEDTDRHGLFSLSLLDDNQK